MNTRTFVDRARIFVRAGKGGNGSNSSAHNRSGTKFWPDGGPGGKGGDVILRANPHLVTLLDFQYRQHFFAKDGAHGGGNQKSGRMGNGCLTEVPVGTLVFSVEQDEEVLLADLVEAGQEVCVAKGGTGGRANTRQSPAETGQMGEEKTLLLELKLLADVGLIGYPNAGKSTLLAAITSAKPKIADYPFTTLVPNLGVVNGEDQPLTVADIPGLIEGAHEGKGLGDEFLRHVERTHLLVLVLDIAGSEGRDPYQDYKVLKSELEKYQKTLLKKPLLVAANKMDLSLAKENLVRLKKQVNQPIYPISAKEKMGLERLILAMTKKLS